MIFQKNSINSTKMIIFKKRFLIKRILMRLRKKLVSVTFLSSVKSKSSSILIEVRIKLIFFVEKKLNASAR